MARRNVGSRGDGKRIIRVFCEGESEQAYTEFLKKEFRNVAVINYPKETGLFERAEDRFNKDPQYRDYKDVIDEVWFFYDVETKDIDKLNERYRIIKKLRKLRSDKDICVRLLMTSGCIEYWLMLHFKKCTPSLKTVEEKNEMMGIKPSALRYYDKEDLLLDVKRVNGIRIFEDKDFGWLRVLSCLKNTGMPISKIKKYVQLAKRNEIRYAFFPYMYGVYPYAYPTKKQLLAMDKVELDYVKVKILS